MSKIGNGKVVPKVFETVTRPDPQQIEFKIKSKLHPAVNGGGQPIDQRDPTPNFDNIQRLKRYSTKEGQQTQQSNVQSQFVSKNDRNDTGFNCRLSTRLQRPGATKISPAQTLPVGTTGRERYRRIVISRGKDLDQLKSIQAAMESMLVSKTDLLG